MRRTTGFRSRRKLPLWTRWPGRIDVQKATHLDAQLASILSLKRDGLLGAWIFLSGGPDPGIAQDYAAYRASRRVGGLLRQIHHPLGGLKSPLKPQKRPVAPPNAELLPFVWFNGIFPDARRV